MTVRTTHRIVGGVHPDYRKDSISDREIETLPLPALLTVPMQQHLGAAATVVDNEKKVLRGQLIGSASGYVSAAVHAPTSGTVKGITERLLANGQTAQAMVIEPDGEDQFDPSIGPPPDWSTQDAQSLVTLVHDAGIVGMGGAGFPTHVKLSPPPNKPIDVLIINGAECEPYLAADYRLMIEHPDAICKGIQVVQKILNIGTIRLAIEDNKPDAIALMSNLLSSVSGDVAVSVLETKYPHGGEKQQILSVTGREVPSGGLPSDIGVLLQNVGTIAAIWQAVSTGEPLTERIVSVSGTPIREPKNVRARIGSSCADLIAFCGGMDDEAAKVICGGPMMGVALHTLDVPVCKTTSGVIALSKDEVSVFSSSPCIACGRCVAACPMRLMPDELSRFLENEDYLLAEQYGVMDCMECGSCAFECPAHRPLVQHMRRGKAEVVAKRRAAKKGADGK